MKIHFVTPENVFNGYGMAEKYLKKYFAKEGIELENTYDGQEISLVLNLAPALLTAKGKRKILYTMIEGDTYPQEWIKLCQKVEVIVPNKWCQGVMAKAGIKSSVVPLGIDTEIFNLRPRKTHSPYTFLHYEAFQDRKGWSDLLNAWMLSLSDREEAQLILKTIKPYDEIPEEVKQFKNVKVISGQLPHRALAELLYSVDCFVFPSRGEGFSLPPLEAMATGLPVILTKGHSHLDYYDERYMYGVEVAKKIPAKYPWFDYPIGSWVRVNVERLAEVIEDVYENRQKAFKKGLQAAKFAQKYTMAKTAKVFKMFLEKGGE